MRVHSMFFYLVSLALVGTMAIVPFVWIAGNSESHKINYSDLVSIQLTSLGVLLAALGIGVAILAFWGYREFMNRAEATAEATAKGMAFDTVDTHLKSEQFKNNVRAVLAELQRDRAAEIVGTVAQGAAAVVAGGEVANAQNPSQMPQEQTIDLDRATAARIIAAHQTKAPVDVGAIAAEFGITVYASDLGPNVSGF